MAVEPCASGTLLFQAALNMIIKNLSLNLKKLDILATALHPGFVDTYLTKTVQSDKKTTTQESVQYMFKVMTKCQGDEYTGKFYHLRGRELAWKKCCRRLKFYKIFIAPDQLIWGYNKDNFLQQKRLSEFEFYSPVNTVKVMSSWSVSLLTSKGMLWVFIYSSR